MAGELQPTRLPLPIQVPEGAPVSHPPGEAPSTPPGEPTLEVPSGTDLDQVAQDQYDLSVDEALSLGYSVVNLSQTADHHLLVFQAARFKDIGAGGQTYRFGVALEAAISVATLNFKGGLTLPVVAANVQLGLADASSTMSLRGYNPPKPVTLPAWGSFDVSSYGDFQKVVSDLQEVLFDNANIRPVLLATTVPAPAGPTRKRTPFLDRLFNRP